MGGVGEGVEGVEGEDYWAFLFLSCDIERVSGCMGYSGISTVPAV